MTLFELIDNIFQLILMFILILSSLYTCIKNSTKIFIHYFCGAVCCLFSGTLFWTIYFHINGYFPYYFSNYELCFLAFCCFFIGLCRYFYKEKKFFVPYNSSFKIYIIPLFVFLANTTCFLLVGGLLWNLYYAFPLFLIALHSSRNLIALNNNKEFKYIYKFHLCLITYIILVNVMYVVSCFGLNNLYVCIDILSILSFPTMFYYLIKECKS